MYPQVLLELIEQLKNLPGVGEKTAQRYAFKLLEMSNDELEIFSSSIIDAKNSLKYCDRCGNFSSDSLCEICQDEKRDQETLCVVGSIKDIVAIERLEQYPGTYFVLNGLISTVENVLPVDLNINQLQRRLEEGVKEMILALNPTVEGETTALYLAKKFSNQCEITRLAQGLPMGGQLEYVDDLTLLRSMLNRKTLE